MKSVLLLTIAVLLYLCGVVSGWQVWREQSAKEEIMPININCDECRDRIDDSEEVICKQCHDNLKTEKDNLEQEMQRLIEIGDATIAELRSENGILKDQVRKLKEK